MSANAARSAGEVPSGAASRRSTTSPPSITPSLTAPARSYLSSFMTSRYRIFQCADRFDRDGHRVAGLEKPRRIEADAHTRARARRDEVPRLEGHHLRER